MHQCRCNLVLPIGKFRFLALVIFFLFLLLEYGKFQDLPHAPKSMHVLCKSQFCQKYLVLPVGKFGFLI